MSAQHKELAGGKWAWLSLCEQMANVGSEVSRALTLRNKGSHEYSERALHRALELLDLSLADAKNRERLREIARTRVALDDHLAYENTYRTTEEQWRKHFLGFAYAARRLR